MKIGIQYSENMTQEAIWQGGFRQIEIPFGSDKQFSQLSVAGVVVQLRDLTEETLQQAIQQAVANRADYLVVDTMLVQERQQWMTLVEVCREQIGKSGVKIFIENGCVRGMNGKYHDSDYSDAVQLLEIIQDCNAIFEQDIFAIAMNVGNANLLQQNICALLETAKGYVGLVHINDNDGKEDQKQIPYTFTQGRGARSTDWVHIIGKLIQQDYEEYLVFDTVGAFARVPKELQISLCRLLYQMAQNWQAEWYFTAKLGDRSKKIILFGTGNFATTYLNRYRDQFPPAFLVDNNPDTWGKYKEKFVVKNPEAILEIPPEERVVLVCNSGYSEIGHQLQQMGVEYQCFWAEYYE